RIYGRLELPLGEELLKPTKIYVKPIFIIQAPIIRKREYFIINLQHKFCPCFKQYVFWRRLI
ncbi:hypothetical protein PDK45_29090, partial [Bacillus cereus]|nr:hypothetical protein [Bacillus cereus]